MGRGGGVNGGREWGERQIDRQTDRDRERSDSTRTLSYSGIVALAPKDLSDS